MDITSFIVGLEAGRASAPPASGGGGLNIHYSEDTPPEDTSMLWAKTNTPPDKIALVSGISLNNLVTYGFSLTNAGGSMLYPAIATIDGKVYRFGGKINSSDTTSPIIRVDPVNDTQTVLEAVIPVVMTHIVCGVVGKKAYLFGGYDGSNYYNSIYVFDSETEQLEQLSHVSMPSKCGFMCCGSYGTKIYLVHGIYGGSISGNVYVFDTEAETLDYVMNCGYSLFEAGCAVIGSKMYIIQGRSVNNISSSSFSVYLGWFDMETEKYHRYNKTPGGLGDRGQSVFVYNSKVYAIGGMGYTSRSGTVYVYDFTEKDWTRETFSTNKYTAFMSAAYVGGRSVWLFDGYTFSSSASSATTSSNKNKCGFYVEDLLLENESKILIGSSNEVEIAKNLSVGVGKMYIGNEDDNARKVNIAVYKDGAWTDL